MSGFDRHVAVEMKEARIPGLAVAIVRDRAVAETSGFGFADLELGVAMTPATRLNVASVTKTVTATAVAHLWEHGRLALDDDVGDYLPFAIRHPDHPGARITVRQLLTHRSALNDGPAYDASYAPGDPVIPLAAWLSDYLIPGGSRYDPAANFAPWPPGTRRSYSNVAYGLLGMVVETASGSSFEAYCRQQILEPLGMSRTSFRLVEDDAVWHATPYTWVPNAAGATEVVLRDPARAVTPAASGGIQVPHLLYGFPTAPDGLLRSTAADLARFVAAFAAGGSFGDTQILRPETVATMLRDDAPEPGEPLQGLAWTASADVPGVWRHSGSDPGVSTLVQVHPAGRSGVVLLANADQVGSALARIADRALA